MMVGLSISCEPSCIGRRAQSVSQAIIPGLAPPDPERDFLGRLGVPLVQGLLGFRPIATTRKVVVEHVDAAFRGLPS